MANPEFPSFPPCCQSLLIQLSREGKLGQRNCVKGHAVSLEYARVVEEAAAKAAADKTPQAS